MFTCALHTFTMGRSTNKSMIKMPTSLVNKTIFKKPYIPKWRKIEPKFPPKPIDLEDEIEIILKKAYALSLEPGFQLVTPIEDPPYEPPGYVPPPLEFVPTPLKRSCGFQTPLKWRNYKTGDGIVYVIDINNKVTQT